MTGQRHSDYSSRSAEQWIPDSVDRAPIEYWGDSEEPIGSFVVLDAAICKNLGLYDNRTAEEYIRASMGEKYKFDKLVEEKLNEGRHRYGAAGEVVRTNFKRGSCYKDYNAKYGEDDCVEIEEVVRVYDGTVVEPGTNRFAEMKRDRRFMTFWVDDRTNDCRADVERNVKIVKATALTKVTRKNEKWIWKGSIGLEAMRDDLDVKLMAKLNINKYRLNFLEYSGEVVSKFDNETMVVGKLKPGADENLWRSEDVFETSVSEKVPTYLGEYIRQQDDVLKTMKINRDVSQKYMTGWIFILTLFRWFLNWGIMVMPKP